MNKLIEQRYRATFVALRDIFNKHKFKRDVVYLGQYRDGDDTIYIIDATDYDNDYTQIMEFETVEGFYNALQELQKILVYKHHVIPLMWVAEDEPLNIPSIEWFSFDSDDNIILALIGEGYRSRKDISHTQGYFLLSLDKQ